MNWLAEYSSALTIVLGGIATLAIFSFLIAENPVYRFFEHLFIGIAAGFLMVFTPKTFLWPRVLEPMLGMDIQVYPDGTFTKAYDSRLLLFLIPMLYGMLFYFIYSKRYSWLSKLVIGSMLAVGSGLAFKGFFNENIPLVTSSFKPLVVMGENGIDWLSSFNNVVFVFTLLSVMYYFFFSVKVQSSVSRNFAASGRWMMMISFGAFFGSTVMARMSLLVERLQFLIHDWFPTIKSFL